MRDLTQEAINYSYSTAKNGLQMDSNPGPTSQILNSLAALISIFLKPTFVDQC